MRDRLQGLLLILAGCISLVLLTHVQHYLAPLLQPPAPPGVPVALLPASSPFACLLPMIGLGSVGLGLLGIKKLLWPEDWQPPKHRG